MELLYTVKFADETHKIKVSCECGKCNLLTEKQLNDLRNKVRLFMGKDSPEEIKVVCN